MEKLPAVAAGKLYLVILSHPAAHALLLEKAAALALRSPLRVLDGGNRFNVYPVAQALRRLTPAVHPALERIRVARAFTCYQMAAMLWQAPANQTPVLVLDMLATYQDESVPLGERRRLLKTCLPHLRRLSQFAPVLVSVRPGDPSLSEMLAEVADEVWSLEVPQILPAPRLFPG